MKKSNLIKVILITIGLIIVACVAEIPASIMLFNISLVVCFIIGMISSDVLDFLKRKYKKL